MKNKIILLFTILSSLSITSFAQTVREKLDKQLGDPKREVNEAKADVYLHKQNEKKIAADSMNISKPPATVKKKKIAGQKKSK